MGMIRTRPSNQPTESADDFRLTVEDRLAEPFSTEFQKNSKLDDSKPEIEVQAFRPTHSYLSRSDNAVVYISIRLKEGLAGVMLGSAEARMLAEALLVSANSADRLQNITSRWT